MSKLTLLLVALLASIGLNVYLFARRDSGTSDRPTTPAASSSRMPTILQPARPPADAGAATGPVPSSDLDRAALERRLAETEARLAALLPPPERFKAGEPNPENEERVRPHLDRIFKVKAGDAPPYDVECRGDVCHLTTNAEATMDERNDWMHHLQSDVEIAGMFDAIDFISEDTYMIMNERKKAAAFGLLVRIRQSLAEGDASKLIGECKENNPTPAGALNVVVTLNVATRRLVVAADGELAKQPVGVCVRRVVDDTMARIEISADVTSLDETSFPISVP